jgi:hypothetical protein
VPVVAVVEEMEPAVNQAELVVLAAVEQGQAQVLVEMVPPILALVVVEAVIAGLFGVVVLVDLE